MVQPPPWQRSWISLEAGNWRLLQWVLIDVSSGARKHGNGCVNSGEEEMLAMTQTLCDQGGWKILKSCCDRAPYVGLLVCMPCTENSLDRKQNVTGSRYRHRAFVEESSL